MRQNASMPSMVGGKTPAQTPMPARMELSHQNGRRRPASNFIHFLNVDSRSWMSIQRSIVSLSPVPTLPAMNGRPDSRPSRMKATESRSDSVFGIIEQAPRPAALPYRRRCV